MAGRRFVAAESTIAAASRVRMIQLRMRRISAVVDLRSGIKAAVAGRTGRATCADQGSWLTGQVPG
jgi:hypothetical protein